MSILVAMSGGVDSSVSALLCMKRHDVCRGATMLLYLNEALGISSRHPCCSRENIVDAKAVCEILGIEHEVLNYMKDFEDRVIKKFVNVYESGGTPNPCIDCNRFMKFDAMLRHAESLGLEKIATGHYA
ncbi:MAG: tRNA 2-thiouridine(34) synthase MnmA, partial [Synergistaceae bacterium]|nr:tRNA 2-thiouridine(34) synthase MnmA [Synergistaceae bacterium]